MKVTQTVIVDGPCPLCHRSDTAGPFTCNRCGVNVCKDCHELSSLGLDKGRRRILCKTCVDVVEAQEALDALAKDNKPPWEQDDRKKGRALSPANLPDYIRDQQMKDYMKKLKEEFDKETAKKLLPYIAPDGHPTW